MCKIITICYGRRQEWRSRKEAEDFFMDGVFNSEGAEQARYLRIIQKLRDGNMIATDEVED